MSRRRFLLLTTTVLGAGGLLTACQSAAPPTAAPATAAPGATGASPLRGTKLTIIGGNSYVPAQDGELDALVKQLGQDTGMDAKAAAPTWPSCAIPTPTCMPTSYWM